MLNTALHSSPDHTGGLEALASMTNKPDLLYVKVNLNYALYSMTYKGEGHAKHCSPFLSRSYWGARSLSQYDQYICLTTDTKVNNMTD